MSQQNSAASGVASQKQRTNVYTMMLILSFIALVVGCTVLYLELTSYGEYPWWKTSWNGLMPPFQQHLANAWNLG